MFGGKQDNKFVVVTVTYSKVVRVFHQSESVVS